MGSAVRAVSVVSSIMELSWAWALLVVAVVGVVVRYFRKRVDPLEHEGGRRKAREGHRKSAEFYAKHGVRTSEEYMINSRGAEIFTKQWVPAGGRAIKGLILYCHGYGDTCVYTFEDVATRLAAAQYAVMSLDYEGHGQSSGLHVYIKDFNHIVDDVSEYASRMKKRPEFHGLPCFLIGESMGGAVAIKTHWRQPNEWDGAILLAPMCKIADDMMPHKWVKSLLLAVIRLLLLLIPTWQMVPTHEICSLAFRVPEKRQQGYNNFTSYRAKPRFATAYQLLVTTDEIESRLHEISLPLLILHGGCDMVTDPAVSRLLYEEAISKDKTLHIYDDSWHALLTGEPDDVVDRVFSDILFWLSERSLPAVTVPVHVKKLIAEGGEDEDALSELCDS